MKRARGLILAGVPVTLITLASTALVTTTGNRSAQASPAKPFQSIVAGAQVTVSPGAVGLAFATCKSTAVPISGEALTGQGERTFITDSFSSGASWFIRVRNTGTTNETLQVVVHCLP